MVRRGYLPSPDTCSRTSSASDEPAASPSTDTPDDRLRPSDDAVQSRQSRPFRARPDPSQSGSARDGYACVCRRNRHRRRTSVSWGSTVVFVSDGYFTRDGSLFQSFLSNSPISSRSIDERPIVLSKSQSAIRGINWAILSRALPCIDQTASDTIPQQTERVP